VGSNGRRDLEKEKYWRNMIPRWESSGLSKPEFSQKENISLASLNNWISIIDRRDEEKRRELARDRVQRTREQQRKSRAAKSSPKFVEAKLSKEYVPKQMPDGNQIEISTPDGFVIKLPISSNSAFLFAILQALR
jgi:hypothetical protein